VIRGIGRGLTLLRHGVDGVKSGEGDGQHAVRTEQRLESGTGGRKMITAAAGTGNSVGSERI